MKSVALYSLKGGVGKTTLAVNLAWFSAELSARRTLLWDLDPQAAASFLLQADRPGAAEAQAVFSKDADAAALTVPSAFDRLDVLPADTSLRGLDRFFFGLGKKRRLEKLLAKVGKRYDRILLDCSPGLTETSDQVLRAADLVIVPVIPSPLSRRAFEEVVAYLDRHGLRRGALLPVFNLVDRRRSLHRATLAEHPDWPVIPTASAIEGMSTHRRPIGDAEPRSPASIALRSLWTAIERRLDRS